MHSYRYEQPSNDNPQNIDEDFLAVNVRIIEQVVEKLVNEGLETLV